MNNRRKLVIALGAFALLRPLISFTQQPTSGMHRIGFLGPTSAAGIASRLEAFRAGLRDLGYVEGKNLMIEFRWAEGKYDRLSELSAELVRLNVDLIVTYSTSGVRAAKQATTTVPIVIASVGGDPVASGLVASLARPGGNITGSTFVNADLSAKRLELLKEAFPRMRRVAVLLNPDSYNESTLEAMERAAKSLKLELHPFKTRGPDEFESAFSAMSKKRVDAITIYQDAMLIVNAKALAKLAAERRLPGIGFAEFAEAGGLMSYGVNALTSYRRAAYFVDRILRGAKPSDLPVEQATKFDLVVNKKAAKALGIRIPNSILVRADKVIE